jgi:DNA invertase Pin-like site-specific DNA recombinase
LDATRAHVAFWHRTAVSRYARACPRPHGRLMLTVLGGLAEFERELIRARTGEGRKRAKERGVRFGRPRKLTPHQRQEALRRLAAGEDEVRSGGCRKVSQRTTLPVTSDEKGPLSIARRRKR